MSYRDDLQAALSRLESLERELAEARRDAAELAGARTELERLRGENETLRRGQYALPRVALVRLAVGLALAALASFAVVASWGAEDGMPPTLGLEAGPLAGVGALVAALLIGFGGPHRAAAVTVLGGTGLMLAAKPWAAPVVWMGSFERHTFNVTSETHLYFLIPGLVAVALAALLGLTVRRPGPS